MKKENKKQLKGIKRNIDICIRIESNPIILQIMLILGMKPTLKRFTFF